eukprot:TRINITY_DN2231_c3_g3_i4.p1 TRINITY_DN2231_c3_g3~~TRINITY_DN2231_c3_g3_i4.p1  ORF type:complete len:305 (-),score=19.66 TRINITY_DN2231_c3_g3_i4:928-1842(-)
MFNVWYNQPVRIYGMRTGTLEEQARECEVQILQLLKEEGEYQEVQDNETKVINFREINGQIQMHDTEEIFRSKTEQQKQIENIQQKNKSIYQGVRNGFAGSDSIYDITKESVNLEEAQVINNLLNNKVKNLRQHKSQLIQEIKQIRSQIQSKGSENTNYQNKQDDIQRQDPESYQSSTGNSYEKDQEDIAGIDYTSKLSPQERMNILVQALCEAYKSCRTERQKLRRELELQINTNRELQHRNMIVKQRLRLNHETCANQKEVFDPFDNVRKICVEFDSVLFKFYSSYKHASFFVMIVVLFILC